MYSFCITVYIYIYCIYKTSVSIQYIITATDDLKPYNTYCKLITTFVDKNNGQIRSK